MLKKGKNMLATTDILDSLPVPPQVRRLWREISPSLLPLQQQIISSEELFNAESLLIHAPTSSGKSFLAELAMVVEAFNGGCSIHLVPLRVQAEEIYKTLKQRYEKFGLKVLISTRDYRAKDNDLEKGNFHIAVVVYEKMLQTCAKNPDLRNKITRIIFDDVDLLFDFDRGEAVDFLISLWKLSPAKKIYLSASLPQADKVVDWLNTNYVYSDFRPVELKKGVLYNGTFYYLDANGEEQEEDFWTDTREELNPVTGLVKIFYERGEQTLIFMKSRNEVRKLAWELANTLSLPPAGSACEWLMAIEPTHARDFLMELFQCGIGIHHSDLLQEEREIVEKAFRCGEIKVLVSTNTLAKGLNLPVDNVIISPEKWNYSRGSGSSSATTLPLPLNEFENMAGRAGRYNLSEKPGRAILIAHTEREKELFFQWYIRQGMLINPPEAPNSRIDEYLMSIMASCGELSAEELEEFARSTWWGWQKEKVASKKDNVKIKVNSLLRKALRKNLCIRNSTNGSFSLTPFGKLISIKGISISTFDLIQKWLVGLNPEIPTELEILLMVSITEDGYLPQFELSIQELLSRIYVEILKEREPSLFEKLLLFCPFLKDEPKDKSNLRLTKACKVSLVLEKWLEGRSLREIEDEFSVSAGQVISASQRLAWLIEATAGIAEMLGLGMSHFLKEFSERLRLGVPSELLTLTRGHHLFLGRSILLSLHRANLNTWERIHKAPLEEILAYLPEDVAKMLKGLSGRILSPDSSDSIPEELRTFDKEISAISKKLKRKKDIEDCLPLAKDDKEIEITFEIRDENVSSEPSSIWKISPNTSIILALDNKRPGEAWVEGRILRLPEKQYRLLGLLAREPGRCVSYDEIYRELWGDIIVEDGQIAYQKCLLLRALCSISPEWKNRIRTVSKRGFILELLPEQVKISGCV